MADQKASDVYKLIKPLMDEDFGPQLRRVTQQIHRVTNTTTNNTSNGSASTALANHTALDWIEAHPTKDPAVNKTRTYYSINFGIVGGVGVDESNNILAMLNDVGLSGGGTCVICADNPDDPIHIAKTISIYYSNVHVVFPPGQAITGEDKISLRIMGDYAQITRKVDGTAMKLHIASTVVSNETVLELSGTDTTLMDAEADPALRIVRVGDKIVVRGQNDVSGKAIEKDTTFVKALAKVGSYWQITCTDELDYTFNPTYPASEWPPDLTTGTTIYIIDGSLITTTTTINSTVVPVADGTVFAVGDMVEVGDNRNEYAMNASAITGAGNPYKNPANLEQAQIIAISGNNITLDHALCRSASTTYYAFMALMVPVVNSSISGARISYTADGIRSANALQITYAMDCHIHNCYVDGIGGRKGHGLRISYSYKCSAYRNHIVGAKYTGSGEGYGITVYYATLILVDHNYISGCRHNILLQLATLAKIISNFSIDDRISGIDLHGVYSVRCSIQNNDVSRSSLNTADSTKPGGIRIGNTSHTGGDHYNVIEGNTITGYNSTTADGIDIFAASVGNVIRNNTVIDCTVGLRFGLNSSQITPVQFIDNTLVEGNIFIRCTSRCIEIIAQPTYDGSTSNGKFSQITMIDNISDGNDRHFEITGVVTTLGVSDVILNGNKVINPVNATTTFYGVSVKYTSGFVHIYNNDVSKTQRGIYLQGNGVCHVIGNKTANTVQTDPFTDGTGNTSVNYVDAMTSGAAGIPATIVDAKGDLIVATAADTVARLVAGANDTILIADNTQATGMRWGTSSTALTTTLSITNTVPIFDLIDSDAATDEKRYRIACNGGQWFLQLVNDAVSASTDVIAIDRNTTTTTSIAFTSTNINLNGEVTFDQRAIMRSNGASTAAIYYANSSGTLRATAGLYDDSASPIFGIVVGAAWQLLINSAGAATLTGGLSAAADTDTTSVLGRARVGFTSGLSDYATFAHYDHNTSSNAAIFQGSAGQTIVNTASGQVVSIRIALVPILDVAASGATLTGNSIVTGVTKSGGNISAGHSGTAQGPIHAIENAFGGAVLVTRATLTAASDLLTSGTIDGTSGNPVAGFHGIARHSIGGVIELSGAAQSGTPYAPSIGGGTLTFTVTTGGKCTATPSGAGNWTFSVFITYI